MYVSRHCHANPWNQTWMVSQHDDKMCSLKSLGHVVRKRSIHSTVCVHNLYGSIHHMVLAIVGSSTRCWSKRKMVAHSRIPKRAKILELKTPLLPSWFFYYAFTQFVHSHTPPNQLRSTLTTTFVRDLHSMHNSMSSKTAIASRFNTQKQPIFTALCQPFSTTPFWRCLRLISSLATHYSIGSIIMSRRPSQATVRSFITANGVSAHAVGSILTFKVAACINGTTSILTRVPSY